MLLALTEYHRPQSVSEALGLLGRPGIMTVPLAGGTELTGGQDGSIRAVVDLAELGLDGIDRERTAAGSGEGILLRLGAMVTLTDLTEHDAVCHLADGLLQRAAMLAAPRTIRNAATLGGSLAGHKGAPELLAALAALGARITLRTPTLVRLPLADFLAARDHYLPGSLITEVMVPVPAAGTGGGLARVSRSPADGALLCAAAVARWEGDQCQRARVALLGLEPGRMAVPLRLPSVEAAVLRRRAAAALALAEQVTREICQHTVADSGPDTAVAAPLAAALASAEYRCWVAPVLVRRALAATLTPAATAMVPGAPATAEGGV